MADQYKDAPQVVRDAFEASVAAEEVIAEQRAWLSEIEAGYPTNINLLDVTQALCGLQLELTELFYGVENYPVIQNRLLSIDDQLRALYKKALDLYGADKYISHDTPPLASQPSHLPGPPDSESSWLPSWTSSSSSSSLSPSPPPGPNVCTGIPPETLADSLINGGDIPVPPNNANVSYAPPNGEDVPDYITPQSPINGPNTPIRATHGPATSLRGAISPGLAGMPSVPVNSYALPTGDISEGFPGFVRATSGHPTHSTIVPGLFGTTSAPARPSKSRGAKA
ncbi:hypothetical protein F4819DRAFT_481854 [Hypoxylon fuscum]|nr:hypothetical protein F4819DRAFT_481854 [Hypoxylon fuscum]